MRLSKVTAERTEIYTEAAECGCVILSKGLLMESLVCTEFIEV